MAETYILQTTFQEKEQGLRNILTQIEKAELQDSSEQTLARLAGIRDGLVHDLALHMKKQDYQTDRLTHCCLHYSIHTKICNYIEVKDALAIFAQALAGVMDSDVVVVEGKKVLSGQLRQRVFDYDLVKRLLVLPVKEPKAAHKAGWRDLKIEAFQINPEIFAKPGWHAFDNRNGTCSGFIRESYDIKHRQAVYLGSKAREYLLR